MGNQPSKKDKAFGIVVTEENKIHKQEVQSPSELTGFERVKLIFTKDAYNEESPELKRINESTTLSFILGTIIGGIGRSKVVRQEFTRTNQHTAFENPQEALKIYKNKYMIGFASGGWRLGWRMGVFTFIFMMSGTCLAAYRGKYSSFDHVFGGTVGGLLYKFKEGPKASIAGAVVGAGLGLLSGSLQYAIIRYAGLESPDKFFEWQNRILKEKDYKLRSSFHAERANPASTNFKSMISITGEDSRDIFVLHHDALVGTEQKGLDALETPLLNPTLKLPEDEDVELEEMILVEPTKQATDKPNGIKIESNSSNLLLNK